MFTTRNAVAAAMQAQVPQLGRVQVEHQGGVARLVLADPDAALRQISVRLNLTPPLANHYTPHPAAALGGGGDPLRSPGLTRIAAQADTAETRGPLTGVSPALATRCQQAHDALAAMFAADAAGAPAPIHR